MIKEAWKEESVSPSVTGRKGHVETRRRPVPDQHWRARKAHLSVFSYHPSSFLLWVLLCLF